MITAWLIRNRDATAATWLERDHAARMYSTHEHATLFRAHAAKARRRLARWDYALHIWTRGGTRR